MEVKRTGTWLDHPDDCECTECSAMLEELDAKWASTHDKQRLVDSIFGPGAWDRAQEKMKKEETDPR